MFSRSVLRWLQTIDLSQPYTNPRVDFASGYLIAEIVAHHITTVSMHSFSNFLSVKMRTDNWNQLMKIFISNRIPITQTMVDDVINRKVGAAVKLIEVLYSHFTKRTPCHATIGTISNKAPEQKSDVSILPPPDLPKPQEEPVVDNPPVIPKRQKFIGVSSTQRNGSSADLTPISFESASVVKSGPGFLQLRNQSTPSSQPASDKALDNAVDELRKNNNSAEAIQAFVKCIDDPEHLTLFLSNYPSNMVIQLLKIAAPYFSPEASPFIIDTIGELFIPTADLNTTSVDDLVDFIFAQPSNDPFSHHFLLSKLIEVTDQSQIASALYSFTKRETKFSKALCHYILDKVAEYKDKDPSYVLPEVVDRLLEFDYGSAALMIPMFQPTNDPKKDLILSNLYIHAASDCLSQIQYMLQNGDRAIAAHILDDICNRQSLSKEDLVTLLLSLNDPGVVLTNEFSVMYKNENIVISPLINKLDPLELVNVICQKVIDTQPDNLADNEIVIMNVLIKKVEQGQNTQEWLQIFQTLNEFLYLAFCDVNCCKQAAEVCLTFYRILQNDVFATFSNLFKALNFVFPTTCPAFCKSTSIEFLSSAAEISASFSQTILKLLMNFPPKTYSDLDKLVAHLKKVRK
ncbi:hypothetical protein TRFO_40297 [Tritrichomonas foetus]|uniref:CH-like domain-containing protein n=1 Tax=Tritrichomonas foetus TaxID=1144522 RepID=A0A1J4J3X0_9EUKA|nr:hypothetical protein TRFO_40297 [Tritrichomonas foetus]|eukprot:OHS93441.1 hypothetical protein TRFO_40297 [Tritrichomonas foetus]